MGTMAERFVSMGSGGSSAANSMMDVEINMDAVRRHIDDLGKMLLSKDDPMHQQLRTIIRKEIKAARSRVAKDVHASVSNDPRAAYRAVRHTVYKSVFGGTLNILSPRRAGARYQLQRTRKLDANPHQRGGNRRPRTQRTEALETYYGKDRGFVLRFLNSGTNTRHIAIGVNARRGGNRGSISGRGVFSTSALFQSQAAIEAISEAFEQEFEEVWNEI